MSNKITIEFQRVKKADGTEEINLKVMGDGQADLSTWPYGTGGHYACATFYTIEMKQVLGQMVNLLSMLHDFWKEKVAV